MDYPLTHETFRQDPVTSGTVRCCRTLTPGATGCYRSGDPGSRRARLPQVWPGTTLIWVMLPARGTSVIRWLLNSCFIGTTILYLLFRKCTGKSLFLCQILWYFCFQNLIHDLKLMLLKFAEEKSFSVDSGGGGPQSNLHTLPYLAHVALYTINSSRLDW